MLSENILFGDKLSPVFQHGFLRSVENVYLHNLLVLFGKYYSILPSSTDSIMSQIIFHFNFTFSGINIPVILNKCMFPAVLHHLIST